MEDANGVCVAVEKCPCVHENVKYDAGSKLARRRDDVLEQWLVYAKFQIWIQGEAMEGIEPS